MGIIKKLQNEVEKLQNEIKILEEKFNNLRMNTDSINYLPPKKPDDFDGVTKSLYQTNANISGGEIRLKLIREETVTLWNYAPYFVYIPSNNRMKIFLILEEIKSTSAQGYVSRYYHPHWEEYRLGSVYGEGRFFRPYYKIRIAESGMAYKIRIHYKIYELMYDFGQFQVI